MQRGIAESCRTNYFQFFFIAFKGYSAAFKGVKIDSFGTPWDCHRFLLMILFVACKIGKAYPLQETRSLEHYKLH